MRPHRHSKRRSPGFGLLMRSRGSPSVPLPPPETTTFDRLADADGTSRGAFQPEEKRTGTTGHQVATHYLATLTTSLVAILLGVVTGSISARLLHPTGRGQLASIQLWPIFLATIALFGMPESVTYFAAKHREASRQYLANALVLALGFSLPLISAAYILLPHVLSSKGQTVIAGARIYLAYIPCYAFLFLPIQAVRGIGRVHLWNVLRVLPTVVWFVILLGLFVLSRSDHVAFTATALAKYYLVGLGVLSVFTITIVMVSLKGSIRLDRSVMRPLLRYGVPGAAAVLPVLLVYQLDQLVMTIVVSPHALGLYVVAVAWGGAVLPILSSLGSLVLPKIATRLDKSQQHALLTRSSRVAVLLALVVTPPALVLTPFAIHLIFGPLYGGSVSSAYLLVLASAFLGISYVLSESVLGLGLTHGPLRAGLVSCIIVGISLAVLLPEFGIIGAAISSLMGYTSMAVVLLIEARKATGSSFHNLCIPKVADVRMLLAIVHSLVGGKSDG
jgi:O-antigen/teichoic acid export membrane protein